MSVGGLGGRLGLAAVFGTREGFLVRPMVVLHIKVFLLWFGDLVKATRKDYSRAGEVGDDLSLVGASKMFFGGYGL